MTHSAVFQPPPRKLGQGIFTLGEAKPEWLAYPSEASRLTLVSRRFSG
jgi:hypothetical protein